MILWVSFASIELFLQMHGTLIHVKTFLFSLIWWEGRLHDLGRFSSKKARITIYVTLKQTVCNEVPSSLIYQLNIVDFNIKNIYSPEQVHHF